MQQSLENVTLCNVGRLGNGGGFCILYGILFDRPVKGPWPPERCTQDWYFIGCFSINRIPGQLLWTCEPAIGRSYVTQGDRSFHDLPPPPPLWCSGDHHSVLPFPDSTSPGPAASPIGWIGSHMANYNGGDLYPMIIRWRDWLDRSYLTHQFLVFYYIFKVL